MDNELNDIIAITILILFWPCVYGTGLLISLYEDRRLRRGLFCSICTLMKDPDDQVCKRCLTNSFVTYEETFDGSYKPFRYHCYKCNKITDRSQNVCNQCTELFFDPVVYNPLHMEGWYSDNVCKHCDNIKVDNCFTKAARKC